MIFWFLLYGKIIILKDMILKTGRFYNIQILRVFMDISVMLTPCFGDIDAPCS